MCDQRHTKCSGDRPKCTSCKENGWVCVWKGEPEPRASKASSSFADSSDNATDKIRIDNTTGVGEKDDASLEQSLEIFDEVMGASRTEVFRETDASLLNAMPEM